MCGKEIKAEPRIIGGAPVSKNEFPWLVGLGSYWRDEPNCGASLISDRCKCLKINKIQFRQFLVFKKVGFHCGPLHPDWSPPEVPTRELPWKYLLNLDWVWNQIELFNLLAEPSQGVALGARCDLGGRRSHRQAKERTRAPKVWDEIAVRLRLCSGGTSGLSV